MNCGVHIDQEIREQFQLQLVEKLEVLKVKEREEREIDNFIDKYRKAQRR